MSKRDQENLNPTPPAVVAMNIYGNLYSQQNGGSMDFWEKLDGYRKRQCEDIVERVLEASRKHGLIG